MNINRDNYEEFFVLYIDKELTPAENAAVENFIDRNPDLKPELEMLQQTILPLDEMETFGNKNLLFRNEGEPVAAVINELNCEAFFVLYADNELNNNENALVEEFIYRHPQYQENFELIQQVKFQPEKHIVYPDKSTLYRSENDHKVVPMFTRMRSWKMVAAATVLLMIGGTVWYALSTNGGTANDENSLATNNPAVRQPAATDQIKSGKTITDKRNTDQATTDQPKSNEVNNPATLQSPSADDTKFGTDISPVKVQKASDYNSTELAASQHKAASTSARTNDKVLQDVIKKSEQSEKSLAQTSAKKDDNRSNIRNTPNVQQENVRIDTDGLKKNDKNKNDGPDKKNELDLTDGIKKDSRDEALAMVEPDKNVEPNKVSIGPVELKSDNVFTRLANENDEEFEQSDKKNKMRGIFRKVTRVFDKATSREPAENRKGIRIASFSIGLK